MPTHIAASAIPRRCPDLIFDFIRLKSRHSL
jgi:hypothetical protein